MAKSKSRALPDKKKRNYFVYLAMNELERGQFERAFENRKDKSLRAASWVRDVIMKHVKRQNRRKKQ